MMRNVLRNGYLAAGLVLCSATNISAQEAAEARYFV